MRRVERQCKTSHYQEKRRLEALSRQRAWRRDLTAQARQLALSEQTTAASSAASQVEDLDHSHDTSANIRGKERHSASGLHGSGLPSYFSNQLMQHEWLTDIPGDLASNWLVMPRAEGRRCLVIASRQRTVSRTRSGYILHSFASALPGGSRAMHGNAEAFTILDTIFSEADSTYFVIDVMAWSGYLLYDCTAEFRSFWIQSKLAEIAEGGSCQGGFPFAPVPVYPCDPGGLQTAYSGIVPFQLRDGLLFLNKEAHYDLGQSPLALVWKDSHISRYFLDTDAAGVMPECQHIVLQFLDSGHVATGDVPPIIVCTVPHDVLGEKQDQLRNGRLLRFSVKNGGLFLRDGELVGAELQFDGLASQRRGRADMCSKIVFQYLARHSPITMAQLLEVSCLELDKQCH
ncbi:Snurportin-1 [Coccomyxa sp. Obi]|nr:Snurportin-1 [Coccomyxa sp. Obi]